MSVEILREYKFKFYLNAQHYVVFDGKKGAPHPHTWEFTLSIMVPCSTTTPFSQYEQRVDDFLAPYQDTILNEASIFAEKQPTLENIVEVFAANFDRIVFGCKGALHSVEGSEGPTRSYKVTLEDDALKRGMIERIERDVIDALIDEALV